MRSRRFNQRLGSEWRELIRVGESDRPWQLPLAAALSAGLPLFVGAWWGHMSYGIIASLGGLVFLYLPETSLGHRMRHITYCGLGLVACYALGLVSHLIPSILVLVLMLATIAVSVITRRYAMTPPGSFFFVMVAAIAAYTPTDMTQVTLRIGLFASGCVLAVGIAFLYSLHMLPRRAAKPVLEKVPWSFDFLFFEPLIMGLSVGLSLLLAEVLHLQKAYWVPIACVAVLQGTTLRAVWNRQVHRITGTTLGLLLAWGALALPLNEWLIAALVTVLMFLIETTIVRHYAIAAFLITPLAILLAEATALGQHSGSGGALIMTRFYDTLLGASVGFLGGVCLHSVRLRQAVRRALRVS